MAGASSSHMLLIQSWYNSSMVIIKETADSTQRLELLLNVQRVLFGSSCFMVLQATGYGLLSVYIGRFLEDIFHSRERWGLQRLLCTFVNNNTTSQSRWWLMLIIHITIQSMIAYWEHSIFEVLKFGAVGWGVRFFGLKSCRSLLVIIICSSRTHTRICRMFSEKVITLLVFVFFIKSTIHFWVFLEYLLRLLSVILEKHYTSIF